MVAGGACNNRDRGYFCGFGVGGVEIKGARSAGACKVWHSTKKNCHIVTAVPGETGASGGNQISVVFIKVVQRRRCASHGESRLMRFASGFCAG